MISIAFKDLLDKLEEYYGKTIVKLVLGAAGIAFCIFLIGLPIRELIYPLTLWVAAIASGNPDLASAREGVSWVAWAVWLACMLALIVTVQQAKKEWQAGAEAHDKAVALLAEMDARTPELDAAMLAAIADMNAAADGLRAATLEVERDYEKFKGELFAEVALLGPPKPKAKRAVRKTRKTPTS